MALSDAERALIYAIRNTCDALLLAGLPPVTEACPHDQREPAPTSTLGNPQWQCARCHQPVDP